MGQEYGARQRPFHLTNLIEACSDRGWHWVTENLQRFTPSDLFSPDSVKAIGELAILYAQSVRWNELNRQRETKVIGEYILAFCSRAETIHLAQKRPSYVAAYVFPYLALRSTGVRIDGFEDALIKLQQIGYPAACEFIPFRRLELAYLLWKAGLSSNGPTLQEDSETTLNVCRNPAYLITWEIYSITHTLFYLTDFSGPMVKMTPEKTKRAVAIAEGLLVHFWRKKDWDLAGELLLNLLALNRSGTSLYQHCMRALINSWRIDGALPGPYIASLEETKPDTIFKACYHTTLVGLLLCGGHMHRMRSAR